MSLKLREKSGPERDLGITHLSVEASADPITQRKSECRQTGTQGHGQGQGSLRERLGRSTQ